MNITTLLNTLRDAIHDNSATQTWCTAQYTRNHHVYVGVDARKPPDVDEYPLFHLFPSAKAAGYNLGRADHVIGCTSGVYNTGLRTTGKASVVEYTGVANVESLRKLGETAIAAAIPANHALEVVEIEYETVEFFPFFLATMEMTISHDYAQGDDPLA